MKKTPLPDLFLTSMPLWIFLLASVVSNGLLSFVSLPASWKLWIFFFGILLPLVGIPMTLKSKPEPLFDTVSFHIPTWFWMVLLAGAILLRLYRLTTLAAWPLQDEAMHSYLGLELVQGQKPQFFYTCSQFPPFYIWGLGLLFKFFEPSLFSLWLFPALISILTVAFGYAATRFFFPARFSFLAFLLLAFSFWPLVEGRFSHAGVLVLLWECLAFTAAGYFWKADTPIGQRKGLVLFGAATGLGFYAFTSWPAIALSMAYLAWVMCKARQITWREVGRLYGAPLLLLAAPYFYFLFTDGPMGHYIASILIPPSSAQIGWNQLLTSLTYFSVLWWGGLQEGCYMPNWGGFLNPLLDAFFFLGLIGLTRRWRSPWIRWGVVSFLLMMLPGALTANIECFRVIQVFPLLLVTVVMGLEMFLGWMKKPIRPWILSLVFAASMGLDGYQLFDICPKAWAPGGQKHYPEQGLRFYPFGEAFELLKSTADQWGPGWILTNLVSPPDPSLIVSTFPFNAAENPKYSQSHPKWGALLVNENCYPFLKTRFPQARFAVLPPRAEDSDGSLMLMVLPLDPAVEPLFSRLLSANRAMREVTVETMHLTFEESHQKIARALMGMRPLFKGDPLLESLFWEAVYLHGSADHDFASSLLALLQAQRSGYPTAAVYNELGYMRFLQGRLQDSRQLYKKATQCPWNHTSALQNIGMIDQLLRSSKLEGMAPGTPP